MIELMAFVIGTCIGSFLNVCIYRIPAAKSIVHPGSMCPRCQNPIRFYDNIPLLSFLCLRRRCRYCSLPIPFRYPLVELLGGLFALWIVMKFGLTPEALIYYIFSATLLVIAFIDIDHRIIPDRLTLPGIPLALLAALFLPDMTLKQSLWGIAVGGGSLLAVAWGYHLITHKEGMGGGDIKLLAMIGALLGWKGVLFTIFAASILGTVSGVIIMFRTKGDMKLAVPFGPFLSIGALTFVFFGADILFWYFNLL